MPTRLALWLDCLYKISRLPGFTSAVISSTPLSFISKMKECITKAFICMSWITCRLKLSMEGDPPSMSFQVVPPQMCSLRYVIMRLHHPTQYITRTCRHQWPNLPHAAALAWANLSASHAFTLACRISGSFCFLTSGCSGPSASCTP